MALLPQTTLVGGSRSYRLGAVLLLALAGGCATFGPPGSEDTPPPPAPVHQIVATWQPHIAFAPDPTHGGTQSPGLAGRLYLFGPEIGFPLVGDGALVVDLYDETASPEKPGVPREEWRIDPVTLKRLLRRDTIGWGYTLFLPWGSYRPEMTRVRLKVCYQPTNGSPLYMEGSPMNLASENGRMTETWNKHPIGNPPSQQPVPQAPRPS